MAHSDYALSRFIQQNLQIPVYALTTGPKPTFPCCVYSKRSGLGTLTMSGPSYKTEVFTFSIKAKTLATARKYADQVYALLHNYNNEVFAVNSSEIEDYDDADELYFIDQDFQCIVGATLPYYNLVRGDGVSGSIALWNDKYVVTSSNALSVEGPNIHIAGNLVVDGTINVVVSSSFATAAFADHSATASYLLGSVESASYSSYALTASYALNSPTLPLGLVSSSAQIDFNNVLNQPTTIQSASYATVALTALNVQPLPSGVVSSSAQVDFNDIQNKPATVATASWAVNALTASYALNVPSLPVGVVSASAQIDYTSIQNKPAAYVLPVGVVSASAQVDYTDIQNKPTLIQSASYAATASYALNAIASLPAGMVSSSTQIDFNTVQNKPTTIPTASYLLGFIESASYAATASYVLGASALPSGTVSSSAQVDFNSIQNQPSPYVLPVGVVSSSVQVLVGSGVYSASAQLPSGLVTSSTQIDFNDLRNRPTSIDTASYVATASWALNAVTASYALNSTALPSGVISSSVQAAGWTVATASYALNVQSLPDGLFSSSAQVDYVSIQNKPTTVASSSYALTASYALNSAALPAGVISSSVQVDYNNVTNKPSPYVLPVGVISSSAQVLNGSGIYSSSAQLPSGMVTSSAQIDFNAVQNKPTTIATASYFALPVGVVSSSVQVLNGSGIYSSSAQLPTGLVSASAQVDYNSIQNKPSAYVLPNGVVSASAQVLNGTGIYSSSIQLPSGLVSASAQISNWSVATASYVSLPVGIVSSSAQVLNGTGIYSSSLQLPATVSASYALTASVLLGSVESASYALTASYVLGASLPSGVVSSSAQISYTGIQNVPTTFAPSAHTHNSANLTDMTGTGQQFIRLPLPNAITFPRINADNTVTAITPAATLTTLGATTVGGGLFSLTNPGAISFLRINANNSVSTLNLADFRTEVLPQDLATTATPQFAATKLTSGSLGTATTGVIEFDGTNFWISI